MLGEANYHPAGMHADGALPAVYVHVGHHHVEPQHLDVSSDAGIALATDNESWDKPARSGMAWDPMSTATARRC